LPYGRARARTVSYCHYYGDATIMDACVYGSMPLNVDLLGKRKRFPHCRVLSK